MACPCCSLIPASKVLKERSISWSSGDVDLDELADVDVVSGLDDDDVVPLELELSVHELPDRELADEPEEDSLVVVSDTGCKLAD